MKIILVNFSFMKINATDSIYSIFKPLILVIGGYAVVNTEPLKDLDVRSTENRGI